MVLDVVYSVLSTLWVLEIPSFPNEFISYIEFGFQYITSGLGLIANYTPLDYLVVLFSLVVTVDLGFFIINFVMWVIKKIPIVDVQ